MKNPNKIQDKDIIQRSFQSWKIVVAILLGVSVAVFMLYRSLNQTYFIDTNEGGTHSWVDFNHNNHIDRHDVREFVLSPNGTYKQQQLTDILTEINWTTQSLIWICLSIVFMVGRDAAFMWRIRILSKKDLSWKQSFYVIMIWEFASALAPGVAGGTAVAMFILNKEKIEFGRSTAIVFVTALMDNLFFILMIPLVFVFIDAQVLFPDTNHATSSIYFLFWLAYGVKLTLAVLLATTIFVYPNLIKRIMNVIFRLSFLKKWKHEANTIGENLILTSQIMRKEKGRFWIEVFASTWVSWVSRYLVINCVIAAFISINTHQHLLVLAKQLMLWIIMMISPTPGGSGVAEFAFGKLMLGLGASSLLLAGLAIVWRLIAYFPYLFIGAILLPKWLKKER